VSFDQLKTVWRTHARPKPKGLAPQGSQVNWYLQFLSVLFRDFLAEGARPSVIRPQVPDVNPDARFGKPDFRAPVKRVA
jgi:hypothetical protein